MPGSEAVSSLYQRERLNGRYSFIHHVVPELRVMGSCRFIILQVILSQPSLQVLHLVAFSRANEI